LPEQARTFLSAQIFDLIFEKVLVKRGADDPAKTHRRCNYKAMKNILESRQSLPAAFRWMRGEGMSCPED
jgi:hypothetical protein